MSADNIIYIRKIKNRYWVWEQSASVSHRPQGGVLKKFNKKHNAYRYALKLQEGWQTEYGICELDENNNLRITHHERNII